MCVRVCWTNLGFSVGYATNLGFSVGYATTSWFQCRGTYYVPYTYVPGISRQKSHHVRNIAWQYIDIPGTYVPGIM